MTPSRDTPAHSPRDMPADVPPDVSADVSAEHGGGRAAVLRERNFRIFLTGQTASLLGSAMANLAVAFAVIESGGGATALGLVSAARVLPIVLFLPLGGVAADRFGSRRMVMTTDGLQCATQLVLALLLLGRGAAPLSAILTLVALWGAAEAIAMPAVGALPPQVAPAALLTDANALLGMARSVSAVAGPSLAGVVVAVSGPTAVLWVDALSFAVSVLALALVRVGPPSGVSGQSLFAELRDGWSEFRSRTWLWVTTVHVSLFNLVVWAPFLVLGPVLAESRYTGATSWGVVMGTYGLGSVLGGLMLLGRRPRRPLRAGTLASACWALPSTALALHAPLAGVCAAALVAGVGGALCTALYTTVVQQRIPLRALGRVSAYGSLGAFALGPLGFAVAGPLADVAGTDRLLWTSVAWQCVAAAVVCAVPAVRTARNAPEPNAPEPNSPEDGPGDGPGDGLGDGLPSTEPTNSRPTDTGPSTAAPTTTEPTQVAPTEVEPTEVVPPDGAAGRTASGDRRPPDR